MQPTSACGQYQAARVASGGAGIRGGRGAGDDAVVAAHDGADDDGAGDDAVLGAHDGADDDGAGDDAVVGAHDGALGSGNVKGR